MKKFSGNVKVYDCADALFAVKGAIISAIIIRESEAE